MYASYLRGIGSCMRDLLLFIDWCVQIYIDTNCFMSEIMCPHFVQIWCNLKPCERRQNNVQNKTHKLNQTISVKYTMKNGTMYCS